MKIFQGLSNLNNPSRMWALSDHMIFWLILMPAAFVVIAITIMPLALYLALTDSGNGD